MIVEYTKGRQNIISIAKKANVIMRHMSKKRLTIPNVIGRMTYKNGDVYEGNFVN